jgi:hypothetical protein
MGLSDGLKSLATKAGRAIEYALTGQSDFAVITSEFKGFSAVGDITKAKIVLDEARQFLRKEFSIQLRAPVIIEIFNEDEVTLAALQRRMKMHHTVGYYKPEALGDKSAHTVYVQKGLSRPRFKAVAAHEMVHAFEREAGLLRSHYSLREGFARWVEYKVLLSEGEHAEAEKLMRLRSWRTGKGIKLLLEVEKEKGVRGVLDYVRSLS